MALLLLILLPLVGTLLLPLLPENSPPLRLPAAVLAIAQLLLALILWQAGPQNFTLTWLPRLGLELSLGLDGVSLPLVLLSGLVTAMAVLATPPDQSRPRLYFGLILATNLGVVTCLLARNALLFLLALELILIPATLLIAIWGGERRAGAAIRYLLYNAVSGICILAAILALAWLNPAGFSFAYSDLAGADLSESSSRWVLALLLVGFGLKLPLVPLHGWQPLAYSQAPAPVAMLLSGSVSKLGAYGLIRFGIEFLPDAWMAWSPWFAGLAAASAVYGALNAIAQSDMRLLVAYSSIGHMGFLLLGLAAATPMSLQGVMALLLAHGTITALLFHLVGVIQRKTGTTAIAELTGLLNPYRGLPFTLGLFLVALMASAGIPGLAGFVGEFLMLEGSWTTFPLATVICLLASGLTAVYAVRLFNRVGFGRLDNDRTDYPTSTFSERIPAMAMIALVVIAGIWPQMLLGWSASSTATLALRAQSFTPLIAFAPGQPTTTLPS